MALDLLISGKRSLIYLLHASRMVSSDMVTYESVMGSLMFASCTAMTTAFAKEGFMALMDF